MAGVKRFECVAGIVYPESGNIDVTIERLIGNGISGYVSPLHSADNEISKPHFHISCNMPRGKGLSIKNWKSIADVCLFANGHFEIRNYPRKYARYLLHLDNPEKEQFVDKTIRTFGDPLPYDLFIQLDDEKEALKAQRIDYFPDVIKWVSQYQCISYASLLLYAINNKAEWVDTIRKNSSPILAFMRSLEYACTRSDSWRDKYSLADEEKVISIMMGKSDKPVNSKDIEILQYLNEN